MITNLYGQKEQHLSCEEDNVMVSCGSGGADRKKRKEKKMPPEASLYHPLVTSLFQIHIIPPLPPKSQLDLPHNHKYNCQGGTKRRMIFTKKKLIPLLVFILSSFSILRLLKVSIITSSSSTRLSALLPALVVNSSTSKHTFSSNASTLTEKELKLLSNLISRISPCNLLIFGLEPQYLRIASINAGGYTIFLEDDPEKIAAIKTYSNSTQIYKVEYNIPAGDAYNLLKHARENPACAPNSGPLEVSTCKLALTKLPREVYKLNWDVVVVDGPSGDRPEAPGRMAAIYTASIIARAGKVTHVVVHDVNRMIEKWFSWEFLCDENLVSSKGKLWNFKIMGQSNLTSFCPDKTVMID